MNDKEYCQRRNGTRYSLGSAYDEAYIEGRVALFNEMVGYLGSKLEPSDWEGIKIARRILTHIQNKSTNKNK